MLDSSRWRNSLVGILTSEGYENVLDLPREAATHLVYKAEYRGRPVFLKIPDPQYLHTAQKLNPDSDKGLLTYWRWVNISSQHHHLVGQLSYPTIQHWRTSQSVAPPHSVPIWIPGFGSLESIIANDGQLIERLPTGLWPETSEGPLIPITVLPQIRGEVRKPYQRGLFRRRKHIPLKEFIFPLCKILDRLLQQGIYLQRLDVDHVREGVDGGVTLSGQAHAVVSKWHHINAPERHGGGVSDGEETLIPDSNGDLSNMPCQWQGYISKLGAYLVEHGKTIDSREYRVMGHKLLKQGHHEIIGESLIDFCENEFSKTPVRALKRKEIQVGHFVDTENCRWSVRGLQIDFSQVRSLVESRIEQALGVKTRSAGTRWAAMPLRLREDDLPWEKALTDAGFKVEFPDQESAAKDESDDAVILNRFENIAEKYPSAVMYTAEGKKFAATVRKYLEKDLKNRLWLISFGQPSNDWFTLQRNFSNRLFIIDTLNDIEFLDHIGE